MAIPASGSGSSGMFLPIARATSLKHRKPARRHSRAGTTGAASGDSDSISAAESNPASSPVTQDDSGFGDRNRTSGRYVVWLSPTSAAVRSQLAYRSGRVSTVDMPDP